MCQLVHDADLVFEYICDVVQSLGLDRNVNEQLHRPVLFCVCMKYLLSDVNIKDVPRRGK